MRIVWAPRAQRRLQETVRFIAADQPEAAARVLKQLFEATRTLGERPHLGRRGRLQGAREFVVARTPYLLIYRVRGELVEILTILDGRRKWPPAT